MEVEIPLQAKACESFLSTRMKKSQSSTEFMVFVGIAIIILMAYFAIAHIYLDLTYKQKEIISGQDLAKQIKNEINLASRVEDNYERKITMPEKIGEKDYTAKLQKREISISINGLDYIELLITDIGQDEIALTPGSQIIIKKENGQVTIS